MSSAHDWINNPLDIVDGMFAAAQTELASGWELKVVEFFKDKLKEDTLAAVPSLNDIPLHYLKPNSLVKFRCLIQDMFDPEFYMGTYETVDPSTKAKVSRCGRYKDVTECGVDLNSRNTVTAERQTFYCVPIPGENTWNPTEQHGNGECKRQETEAPSNQKTSASHLDLNFPLPGEKGPSCLVKVRYRSSLSALFATVSAVQFSRGCSELMHVTCCC
ncbi:hypothetical protein fugu_012768 [Takifugu bimaculatus]|uniref:Mini-chromosome maintenance complex-binding protein n=1 Tax=Takifugu bimaculatus TaxID=433685 RepID=A0A4Z2C6A1_9TELE|nr:hypothetical protein fugu_012768 [Takifugu bimaculatus]